MKLTMNPTLDVYDAKQGWGAVLSHLKGITVEVRHVAGTDTGMIERVWYGNDDTAWLQIFDHDTDMHKSIEIDAIYKVEYQ